MQKHQYARSSEPRADSRKLEVRTRKENKSRRAIPFKELSCQQLLGQRAEWTGDPEGVRWRLWKPFDGLLTSRNQALDKITDRFHLGTVGNHYLLMLCGESRAGQDRAHRTVGYEPVSRCYGLNCSFPQFIMLRLKQEKGSLLGN